MKRIHSCKVSTVTADWYVTNEEKGNSYCSFLLHYLPFHSLKMVSSLLMLDVKLDM